MVIKSGLFKSVNGDRRYKAEDFAEYFATFIGNGVFPNPSTGLQVMSNDDMTTVVKAGKGWINGYYIVNTSDHILTHDVADGVLKRMDRVVLRLDFIKRAIDIRIKKGIPSSTPMAINIQRDADAYELVLADVIIDKGVIGIAQTNITDQRLNSTLCGIVHGVVNQVDTTTIFNQYQAWYEKMTGEKLIEYETWVNNSQTIFDNWFNSVQDILDGNVAGNLLLLIKENEKDIQSLMKIKTDISVLSSGWILNSLTNRYEYKINDPNITKESVVDINIQIDYLEYAKTIISASISSDGFVTMFSKEKLDANLLVDYVIKKEVI